MSQRTQTPTERRSYSGLILSAIEAASARRRLPGRGLGALGGVRAGRALLVARSGDRHRSNRARTDARARSRPSRARHDRPAPGAQRVNTSRCSTCATGAWRSMRCGSGSSPDGRGGRLLDAIAVTQSGPSFTETRTLPADEVLPRPVCVVSRTTLERCVVRPRSR